MFTQKMLFSLCLSLLLAHPLSALWNQDKGEFTHGPTIHNDVGFVLSEMMINTLALTVEKNNIRPELSQEALQLLRRIGQARYLKPHRKGKGSSEGKCLLIDLFKILLPEMPFYAAMLDNKNVTDECLAKSINFLADYAAGAMNRNVYPSRMFYEFNEVTALKSFIAITLSRSLQPNASREVLKAIKYFLKNGTDSKKILLALYENTDVAEGLSSSISVVLAAYASVVTFMIINNRLGCTNESDLVKKAVMDLGSETLTKQIINGLIAYLIRDLARKKIIKPCIRKSLNAIKKPFATPLHELSA